MMKGLVYCGGGVAHVCVCVCVCVFHVESVFSC